MKRVTNSWTYCFFQNSRVPRNESSVSVAFIQWLASITERINQANSAPVQSVFLTFGFRSGSLLNVILLSKQEFLHCHLKKHFLCNIFFHINIYVPCTVCPRSSDPFYVVTYYIKWVTTSWTYSIWTVEEMSRAMLWQKFQTLFWPIWCNFTLYVSPHLWNSRLSTLWMFYSCWEPVDVDDALPVLWQTPTFRWVITFLQYAARVNI